MNASFAGGCGCGAVRYVIAERPSMMFNCQCRLCQRQSGAGHAALVGFSGGDVEKSGEVGVWRTTGEQGTVMDRAFCVRCGCSVYTTFPAMPGFFVVPAASLDQPEIFAPEYVTWASAGQAWDRLAPDIPRFAKMPPAA